MPAVKRRLFNVLAAVSLGLLVVIGSLWARSYRIAHGVRVEKSVWPSADSCVFRYLSVRLVLGNWIVSWGREDYDLRRPDGIEWEHAMDLPTFRKEYVAGIKSYHYAYGVRSGDTGYFLGVPLWHGFGIKRDQRTHLGQTFVSNYAVAPAWPATVVMAFLPVLWVTRAVRCRASARRGRCATCGYDMRATPERCPECGTAVGPAA
jgi:hypothetical protein